MIRPHSESQTQEPLKSIQKKYDGAPTQEPRPPIEEVKGEEHKSSGQAQLTTDLPSFKKKQFNSYFNNCIKETQESRPPIEEVKGEELESLGQAKLTTCWESIRSFLCPCTNILNSCSYDEIIVDNSKNKITHFNNGEYEGKLVNGKPHGYGTFTWSDGRTYDGHWFKGQMHGKGTFTWTDGRTYKGQWKNGKPDGQGTMTYPNGDKYNGPINQEGQPQGYGTYTWTYGRKYTGGCIDNQMNGQGTYIYQDKTTYEGKFEDGKPHGEGTLITWEKWVITDQIPYRKGIKHEGTIVNGAMSLSGCTKKQVIFIKFNDGRTYTGEFQDGNPPQPHGQGKMTYMNGTKYEGGFKDGKRHGKGTITFNKKTITFNNGDTYEGQWEDGKVCGQEKITDSKGNTYEVLGAMGQITCQKNGSSVRDKITEVTV